MAITLVRQEYKSTESKQDYKTRTGTTYEGYDALIDIGKAREDFNKDGKPKCFNYNIYKYMAKDCRKPKKEQDTRKCYKCDKIGYIAKDHRTG